MPKKPGFHVLQEVTVIQHGRPAVQILIFTTLQYSTHVWHIPKKSWEHPNLTIHQLLRSLLITTTGHFPTWWIFQDANHPAGRSTWHPMASFCGWSLGRNCVKWYQPQIVWSTFESTILRGKPSTDVYGHSGDGNGILICSISWASGPLSELKTMKCWDSGATFTWQSLQIVLQCATKHFWYCEGTSVWPWQTQYGSISIYLIFVWPQSPSFLSASKSVSGPVVDRFSFWETLAIPVIRKNAVLN
jgi:hypothetical protein